MVKNARERREAAHRPAAETGCDPRTCAKWIEDATTVSHVAAYALEKAARKCRLDVAALRVGVA